MSKKPQVIERHLKSNNQLLKKKIVVLESKQLTKKNSSSLRAKLCSGSTISINKLKMLILRKSIKLTDPNILSVNTVRESLFNQFEIVIPNRVKRSS